MFRFSPTTNISVRSISNINNLSRGNLFKANFTEEIKALNFGDRIDEEYNKDEQEQKDVNPNSAMIKLLEDKRTDIKKNIEALSIQLKRHIRQIEYIDSRIYELKGEKVELQNSRPSIGLRLESDLYQTNFSRLSTTVDTGINTPNSELANSNDTVTRCDLFQYKMEEDWVIIPEFSEIVSKIVNYP